LGGANKYCLREVCLLLKRVGCDVHHTPQITKKTKRITFNLQTIHYVLVLTNDVPKMLVDECKINNRQILTMEWLRQCVINNKLLDVDSPLFKYNPAQP